MTLRLEPGGAALDEIRLEAGDVVGSRYRLQRPLEEGSGGAVWLATDEVLRRHVAVRLPADNAPRSLERFTEDARAAAGLWHPSLVQIFDFGVSGGQAFLVMEHMPQGSLAQRFQRDGMKVDDLRRVACDLLSALEYLHARGRVHGDVQASRIALDADGRPHLSGFGTTPTGSLGSPTEDLRALGRLLAAAPRHRDDPALHRLVEELLAPTLRAAASRPREALSAQSVCTDPAGQETQAFDVPRLLTYDTGEQTVVVNARVRPSRPSRLDRRASSRRRRARVLRA
ncbi:MAG TPA: protein kinase [Solirubrobacteraceae bacterium]|nr:protein kinase [Solirubrobacteraceae bacterium]